MQMNIGFSDDQRSLTGVESHPPDIVSQENSVDPC